MEFRKTSQSILLTFNFMIIRKDFWEILRCVRHISVSDIQNFAQALEELVHKKKKKVGENVCQLRFNNKY